MSNEEICILPVINDRAIARCPRFVLWVAGLNRSFSSGFGAFISFNKSAARYNSLFLTQGWWTVGQICRGSILSSAPPSRPTCWRGSVKNLCQLRFQSGDLFFYDDSTTKLLYGQVHE